MLCDPSLHASMKEHFLAPNFLKQISQSLFPKKAACYVRLGRTSLGVIGVGDRTGLRSSPSCFAAYRLFLPNPPRPARSVSMLCFEFSELAPQTADSLATNEFARGKAPRQRERERCGWGKGQTWSGAVTFAKSQSAWEKHEDDS